MKELRSGRWSWFLAPLPAVLLAALPRLACPCQLSASAGLLASLGLAFLMQTQYLLPLMATCLTLAVGTLWIGARRRRGYRPFLLGLAATMLLLVGRFGADSDLLAGLGGLALLAASAWHTWPLPRPRKLRFDAEGRVAAI